MKKIAGFLLFFNVFFLFAFGNQLKSSSLVAIITELSGVSDSEATWLGASIEDKLEANLSAYTEFNFVNITNKNQILEIQKKSEGLEFDEASTLAAGRFSMAKTGFFITVRKEGANYSVTIRYTDLETGVTKSTVSTSRKTVEELYAVNGCAIDELTIKICKDLDIDLTPAQIHKLMNGEQELTSAQRTEVYEKRIQNFESQLADLDKEIQAWSISGELDAETFQNQLEIEKKILNERLRVAKENQRRAEADEKKRQEDERKDAQRSAQQLEKIESMSFELQEKLKDLREKNFENCPILGRIKIIELKKKSMVEIQDKIDFEIESLTNEAIENINAKKKELETRKPTVAEQGETPDVLSDSAKANRRREFESEKEKIIGKLEKDVSRFNDKLYKENKILLDEIHEDYNSLKNITVSSLTDDLVVEYSNYDGNKGGWPLYLTVKNDNVIIFQTTSFLSYKELTGDDPVRDNRDPNYREFEIAVDTYESLFLRGEQILTYEMEYSVIPYSPKYPSKYKFQFNYLKYYDTRDMSVWGKKLRSSKTGFLDLDTNSVSRQMYPAYDISNIEESSPSSISSQIEEMTFQDDSREESEKSEKYGYSDYYDYERELEKQRKAAEEAAKKAEKERKKEENKKSSLCHSLIGFNVGFGLREMEAINMELDICFGINSLLYAGYNFNVIIPEKTDLYPIVKDNSLILSNVGKVGLDLDLFLVNIYGSAGIGLNYFTISSGLSDKNNMTISDEDIPHIFDFIFVIDVGASMPLGPDICLSAGYSITYLNDFKKYYDTVDFGVAITF